MLQRKIYFSVIEIIHNYNYHNYYYFYTYYKYDDCSVYTNGNA